MVNWSKDFLSNAAVNTQVRNEKGLLPTRQRRSSEIAMPHIWQTACDLTPCWSPEDQGERALRLEPATQEWCQGEANICEWWVRVRFLCVPGDTDAKPVLLVRCNTP